MDQGCPLDVKNTAQSTMGVRKELRTRSHAAQKLAGGEHGRAGGENRLIVSPQPSLSDDGALANKKIALVV